MRYGRIRMIMSHIATMFIITSILMTPLYSSITPTVSANNDIIDHSSRYSDSETIQGDLNERDDETDSSAIPPVPDISFSNILDKDYYISGDKPLLNIKIEFNTKVTGAVLQIYLPEGIVIPIKEDDSIADKALEYPLGDMDAGSIWEQAIEFEMTEAAADLSTIRMELWSSNTDGAAIAETDVRRSFPPAQEQISPEDGGRLATADGRIEIEFPAKAVETPINVEYRPLEIQRLGGENNGIALKVELLAFTRNEAAESVHEFTAPLTLSVDLEGLVDFDALPYYARPFLGYWDEEKGIWQEIEAERQGNRLTATLDHFTIIGAGVNYAMTSGWLLSYNDAQVATFDGALTYDYPLQVPQGRGGLTPELNLNYNSRRVDGLLTWIQTDWVGLGWSLDVMSIVRTKFENYGGDRHPGWGNEYALVYNGVSYKLKPYSGASTGRYFAEDDQFLYIARRSNLEGGTNGSPSNQTTEYWAVKLRDGTEFRLGYREDSEQAFRSPNDALTCGSGASDEACAGANGDGVIAFRWRADQITSRNGSIMSLNYTDEERGDNHWRENAHYLSFIHYNWLPGGAWGTEIMFNRGLRGDGGDVDDEYERYDDEYFYQRYYLDSITIRNRSGGTTTEIIQEYKFEYTEREDVEGHDNHTRLLGLIREYGRGGIAGGQALPATTFGYEPHWNKGICQSIWGGACTDGSHDSWDQECFRYDRLNEINNGYGGVITASYESPDGGYWHAYNYRVAEKTVEGGQGTGHRLAYTYPESLSDRGYREYNNFGCSYFDSGAQTGGVLVGYRVVTETLLSLNDAIVSSTVHEFKLNSQTNPDRRLGRELSTRYRDANDVSVGLAVTDWGVKTTSPQAYFVYPEVVKEYTAVNGALPALNSPQKRTEYQYDNGMTSGIDQYGELTRVREYVGSTLTRETRVSYVPRFAYWIVDCPSEVTIRNGQGAILSGTRYTYDSLANTYTSLPSRGDPVRVEELVNGPDNWATTQVITYTAMTSSWLPTATADANGRVTQITYDTNWRIFPTTVTNALGQTSTYQYDYIALRLTSAQGPNGSSTAITYQYDAFGRLTKVIRPGDTSTAPGAAYTYYDTASPLRIDRQQNGYTTSTYYSGLGQVLQENRVSIGRQTTIVSDYAYNAQGLQSAVYVPYRRTYTGSYLAPSANADHASYEYDALGRLTEAVQPDGTAEYHAYNGFSEGILDASGHQTIRQSDVLGRLTAVISYDGTFTSVNWQATPYVTAAYSYDLLDRLTQVVITPAGGTAATTTLQYDYLGRRTQIADPDLGTWTYAYDAVGNLVRQQDARGQVVIFRYDALNRLTGKAYCSGNCQPGDNPPLVAGYSYDATSGGNLGIGQRTGMTDTTGSTGWAYDARGRCTSELRTVSGWGEFATAWVYNTRDQVIRQIYPGGDDGEAGEAVTQTYDGYGRPTALRGQTGYAYGAAYDALDRMSGFTTGNYVRVAYNYYPADEQGGRLQAIHAGSEAAANEAQNLAYSYDAAGNVTQIVDYLGLETQDFAYDAFDRLIAAEAEDGPAPYDHTYAYDPLGNITSFNGVPYTYLDATHRHAVTHLNGAATYSYDANGNMTARPWGGVTQTLSYDAENRLTGVDGATDASFGYDGDGRMVVRTVGSDSTVRIGDYYEWDGTHATSYYLFGGRRVAWRTVDGVQYLYADHLGSSVQAGEPIEPHVVGLPLVADGAVLAPEDPYPAPQGQVSAQAEPQASVDDVGDPAVQRYTPYGETRGSEAVDVPYQFTGQRNEDAIGLYHYGARWYDPALGRFIQADTIVPQPEDPQSLNRYTYVYNNPLKYTDPTGHYPPMGGPPWMDPYEWVGLQMGCPDVSEIPEPTIANLTSYTGEMMVTGLDSYNRVVGPLADAGLSMMPGGGAAYDLMTAITGENILGEQLSPLERAIQVAGIFTAIDDFIPLDRVIRIAGVTHAHHWIPQEFHIRIRDLYPDIGEDLLQFTDPLEVNFHRIVHGKGKTLEEAYNAEVRRWLAQYGGEAPSSQFLEFIEAERAKCLLEYAQYLYAK